MTPRLMWIVVRSANSMVDSSGSGGKIDVNSLGFAGTIAVKD